MVWRAGPVGRFRLLRQWHPGIIIAWLVPYGHTALQNPPNAWQYVLYVYICIDIYVTTLCICLYIYTYCVCMCNIYIYIGAIQTLATLTCVTLDSPFFLCNRMFFFCETKLRMLREYFDCISQTMNNTAEL